MLSKWYRGTFRGCPAVDGRTSLWWTTGEIDALRRLYPEHGPRWDGWAEALPGRSVTSIASKAHLLGVLGPTSRLPWSDEEEGFLRRFWPSRGSNWWGWGMLLRGRTARSIGCKARSMGLSRSEGPKAAWTDEQRVRLVRGVKELTGSTGHDLYSCVDEFLRLWRRHEADAMISGDEGW